MRQWEGNDAFSRENRQTNEWKSEPKIQIHANSFFLTLGDPDWNGFANSSIFIIPL